MMIYDDFAGQQQSAYAHKTLGAVIPDNFLEAHLKSLSRHTDYIQGLINKVETIADNLFGPVPRCADSCSTVEDPECFQSPDFRLNKLNNVLAAKISDLSSELDHLSSFSK